MNKMIDEFRCAAPQGLQQIEQRLVKLEMLLVEGLSDDISEHLDVYIRRLRQMRLELFPADFFSDPVWDMLLELNRAYRLKITMTLADLVTTTQIRRSVVKRSLELLEREGFVSLVQNDQSDSWIVPELTAEGVVAMNQLFSGFVETVNIDLEKARLERRAGLAA